MQKDSRSLDVQIRDWLDKEGYPLELQVARAFRKAGFRAHHAMMFDDEVTNGKREIDVVATKQFGQDGRWIRLVVVVECKNNADKPWVCFSDIEHTLDDNQRIKQRMTGGFGKRLLNGVYTSVALFNKGLFEIPQQCVSSVTTAFRKLQDGKDNAYGATSSVMAASSAIAKRFDNSPVAAVVFPVVVVQGHLFQCHLSEAGTMDVNQVSETVLLWRYHTTSHPNAIINIVDSCILDQFVERCHETATALFAIDSGLMERTLGRPTGDIPAEDPSLDF